MKGRLPFYLIFNYMVVVNVNKSGRGMGVPKTEEERRRRHGFLYPGEKLPPRGAGLKRGSAAGSRGRDDLAETLLSILLFAFVLLIQSILSSKERKEGKK